MATVILGIGRRLEAIYGRSFGNKIMSVPNIETTTRSFPRISYWSPNKDPKRMQETVVVSVVPPNDTGGSTGL
jgi:hypothetical protein